MTAIDTSAAAAAASAAAAAAAAAAPTPDVLVLITVGDRAQDVSLACATSMLRLQPALGAHVGARPGDAQVRLDFVPDASAHALQAGQAAVVLDGAVGFEADLVTQALDRAGLVTVGVHARPGVDWDAVSRATDEPADTRGVAYNVTLVPGASRADATARVHDATFEVAVIPPGFAGPGETVGAACARALRAGAVVADLQHPCTRLGPMEYAGCVGLRRVLR